MRETGPPPDIAEPLSWMLLRSDGDGIPDTARHLARWSSKEFFRLLQNGTWLEDRRLQDARSLQRRLACDALTA